MLGTYALSAGYYDAYYGQAQRVRTLIIRDFDAAYQHVDVLLGADHARPRPSRLGAKVDDPLAMYLTDVCTIPSNLAGHPAISVPFGTGDDGLPVGVQVLAPALGETLMFQVAAAIEAGGPAALSRPARTGRATSDRLADRPTDWETVIGLEVHSELRTATKLFCGCRNGFGDEPNTNVCPVCLGLPGSLPVLNRHGGGAAPCGSARPCTARSGRRIFHRKNYFYPDMPKDYQISQYDEPINVDGLARAARRARGSGIVRAHIEEDTGKTTQSAAGAASTRPTTRWSTTTGPACPWSRS